MSKHMKRTINNRYINKSSPRPPITMKTSNTMGQAVQQAERMDPLARGLLAQGLVKVIKQHNISTADVYDALGFKGELFVHPLTYGKTRVGIVVPAPCVAGSSYHMVDHLSEQDLEGCIVFVVGDAFSSGTGKAMLNYNIALHCMLRGAAGIVVVGGVRDSGQMREEKWPIWCKLATPSGVDNHWPPEKCLQEVETVVNRYLDSVIVCDDDGAVLIEPYMAVAPGFTERLIQVSERRTGIRDLIKRGQTVKDAISLQSTSEVVGTLTKMSETKE